VTELGGIEARTVNCKGLLNRIINLKSHKSKSLYFSCTPCIVADYETPGMSLAVLYENFCFFSNFSSYLGKTGLVPQIFKSVEILV